MVNFHLVDKLHESFLKSKQSIQVDSSHTNMSSRRHIKGIRRHFSDFQMTASAFNRRDEFSLLYSPREKRPTGSKSIRLQLQLCLNRAVTINKFLTIQAHNLDRKEFSHQTKTTRTRILSHHLPLCIPFFFSQC